MGQIGQVTAAVGRLSGEGEASGGRGEGGDGEAEGLLVLDSLIAAVGPNCLHAFKTFLFARTRNCLKARILSTTVAAPITHFCITFLKKRRI